YTNNTNAGTAHASASYAGDANHSASNGAADFNIAPAGSTTTVSCSDQTYTGAALTPCSALATGAGIAAPGIDVSASLVYTNNTNAGTAHASASYAGDANHSASNGAADFNIAPAGSTTTVSCSDQTYTGAALTPCSALATGAGIAAPGIDVSASLVYTNNTNAGTAHASASYAGDANHSASNGAADFNIAPAGSTTTVSCSDQTYTGAALTPCSALATGAGIAAPGIDVSASLVYTNNTNAGTAHASASYAGDANHSASNGAADFNIAPAGSTTTVSCSDQTYTGAALTPCSALATGAGIAAPGIDVSASLVYTNNTNAGTAHASASYAGDANHSASNGAADFNIAPAGSTTTVSCSDQTYTGAALTPCSALATGAGIAAPGIDVSASLVYTNNTNAGTAHASASYAGDANHSASNGAADFNIAPAGSTTTVSCSDQTYTGAAPAPCSAQAPGAAIATAGIDVSASLVYTSNASAGTAHASASYVGDANHSASNGAADFNIAPAGSTTTVSCSDQTYTGAALTPCSALATGAGIAAPGIDVSASLVYTNNTNAGTAHASASYAGDANHSASTGAADFNIAPAGSTTTVSCSDQTYTGAALTPCSALATGAGIAAPGIDVSASLVYTNNTNAGTAHATASYAGDANHSASNGAADFNVAPAGSTTTVSCSDQTYTGAALTPCSALATGAGIAPPGRRLSHP